MAVLSLESDSSAGSGVNSLELGEIGGRLRGIVLNLSIPASATKGLKAPN